MSPPTPPLPVPSKAAIRALHGLVLGTTCTLALVTEDRRRRINAARSAIRNGDRIRSARQYHAGGSAFAIALEEESLAVEPGVIHWKSPAKGEGESSNGLRESTRRSQKAKKATPPGLLDWSYVVPPHRRSASPRRERFLLRDPTSPSSSLENALAATSTAELAPSTQHEPDARLPTPPSFPFPPLSSAAEQIQRRVPSLARQAQEYQSRARLGRRLQNSIEYVDGAATRSAIDLPAAAEQIAEATRSRNASDLEAAVETLFSTAPIAASAGAPATSQRHSLWTASAALCRSCQEAGRMDLAQDVLQLAVQCGRLDEAVYFAHNPLPVVQSLAPLVELSAADDVTSMTQADAFSLRDIFVKQLQDATALFLPAFSSAAKTQSATELVAVGKQLLECAFAARHQLSIKAVYSRIAEYPGDISEFLHWYIGQLQQGEDYKLVVSSFLERPPNAGSLPDSSFFEMGDRVVQAVRLSHSPKADEVLGALLESCSGSRRLRTSWVTALLYRHWRKTQKYEEVKNLFANIARNSTNISNTVYHVNGAYRVMVQIALEADEEAEAKSLFNELSTLQLSAAGDIRLLGLFALAKAKSGDWQGVRDDFQTATAAAGPKGLPPRDAERVFVPIVKEYIRSHTIGETEDFLKMYIDEMGVPIGRQMVTLLANEYGALREVRSFVGWLEYCARAGFAIDAAFSNAILQNCRKHWKFGFRDLRTLYRKLRVLNPNFEDKVTQTIMTHAAISDAKHIGRPVQGRVLSLRIQTPSVGSKAPRSYLLPQYTGQRQLDENDLYLSMKQAFASGYPAKVVRIYKHAMRGGMPPSAKCLKLAVAAAVRSGKQTSSPFSPSLPSSSSPSAPKSAEFDAAIELLQTAHAAGQDTDSATAYLAIAYIDALGPRSLSGKGGKASVANAVKSVLCRLDACDVHMSDLALNRAAFHMFKAGHMRGAIALALSAADSAVGGGRPGYNVWNFSVLVSSYARLADADGIRLATEGAAASGVMGELMGYKVLKQARRRLRADHLECECASAQGSNDNSSSSSNSHTGQSAHAQVVQSALRAVEDALDQARAARRQLSGERRELEAAAVSIMRQAALDAGGEPVDFDKVPFLRRQAQASRAATVRGEEDGSSSISSGSSWDLLDMPVDQDGRLVGNTEAAPIAACST